MNLIVVSGGGVDREPGGSARRVRLAAAALRASTIAVLVRSARDPVASDLAPRFHCVVDLDDDQLAGGVALDGVLRDLQPCVLLALGTMAALASGRLVERPPTWMDLPADAVDPLSAPPRPFERESELDRWHEWIWALDRADRVSCADESVARRLETMLAMRGRFAARTRQEPELLVLRDGEGEPDSLVGWIRAPRRRDESPRVMGTAEILDFRRAESTAIESAAIRRRFEVRLGERVRSASRLTRHVAVAFGRAVRSVAASPVIAVETAWLSRSRRSPEPEVSSQVDLTELERRLGRRPRLLIVMPYRIYPPRHGGAVRLAGLVERLSERCEVHLLRFDQRGENRIERVALERFCRRVEFHHWVVPSSDSARDPLRPPVANVFADERVAWMIRHWVESEGIDVVQFEYVEMAQFRAAARPARVILVEHDVAFKSQERRRRLDLAARYAAGGQHVHSLLDLMRLRRYELSAAREVDQLHVMSQVDARRLARYLPDGFARIREVPNSVDTSALAPDPQAAKVGDALFVGNFANLPNRDALEWFLTEVWPLVRAARPKTTLTVAGAEMPRSLEELARRLGARVAGEVADLAVLYRSHRVLAVPLRAGSGTRLKILEAFAAGIPVVSTALGVEGIDATAGLHLVVADEAPQIAREIASLADDAARCENLAENARRLVCEKYDSSRAADSNLRAVLELACATPSPTLPVVPTEIAHSGVEVSIVIPTRAGGALLTEVLEAIAAQRTERSFEVICIDSGSSFAELEATVRSGARVVTIPPESFDHGRTRDLGAATARGSVLVFLNQDAVPVDDHWLAKLTAPLFAEVPPAAVQGGIREFSNGDFRSPRRLYWDSGGPRFNFTSESRGWLARHGGIGFSTVNCAIRREVWRTIPFGRVSILEDKRWQARAVSREYRIVTVDEAAVFHTHDYDLVGLVRRSVAEGEGWRRLGERYGLRQALADASGRRVWRDWWAGVRSGSMRTLAEWLFPLARPLALWRGNSRAGREIR